MQQWGHTHLIEFVVMGTANAMDAFCFFSAAEASLSSAFLFFVASALALACSRQRLDVEDVAGGWAGCSKSVVLGSMTVSIIVEGVVAGVGMMA
jgi:hypothetical protein